MSKLRVAFIGTGRVPEKAGPMGYAMAYSHADGYLALPDDVEMVAAADIRPENSQAFAERYGFSDTFTDYHEMLQEVKPDLVSICTWPHPVSYTHLDVYKRQYMPCVWAVLVNGVVSGLIVTLIATILN